MTTTELCGVMAADYSLPIDQQSGKVLVVVSVCKILSEQGRVHFCAVCGLTLISGEELQSCDIRVSPGTHSFSCSCIHLQCGTPL